MTPKKIWKISNYKLDLNYVILNFLPPTVQLSFPSSPPAQIKLSVSNLKFAPSLVLRNCISQVLGSTIGRSISFKILSYLLLVKLFLPHPALQHLLLFKKKQTILVFIFIKKAFNYSPNMVEICCATFGYNVIIIKRTRYQRVELQLADKQH